MRIPGTEKELQQIDAMYNGLFEMLKDKNYTAVQQAIDKMITDKADLRLVIAMLTITHSVRINFNRTWLIQYGHELALEKGLDGHQIKTLFKGF